MISLRLELPRHIELYSESDDFQLQIYLRELHPDLKLVPVVDSGEVIHAMVYRGNLREECNKGLIVEILDKYPGRSLRTHRGHKAKEDICD